MGDHMPISHLRPEMAPSSINVVGVVISAERPRAPPTKFATPAMKRYVFTFTIRDEHGDSIHASCWGTLDYVSPLYAVCSLGAHVKIFSPRVRPVEHKDLDYFPEVTSKNKLYLDNQIPSTLDLLETEPPLSEALDLNFHTPPKGSNYAKVTVLDLMRDNSAYLEGECVTLVAVVMEIGAILDCKSSDRKCRQEIKLMDRSTKDMYISLILWDSALQMFTMSWKPLATVIQLSAVRVVIDRYTNRKILSATSRTIVTSDPQTGEGRQMASDAAKIEPGQLQGILNQQPEKFIRNKAIKVANVAALYDFARRVCAGGREQVVVNCMITSFPMDRGVSVKCGHCGRRSGIYKKDAGIPPCRNESCREKQPESEMYFDISINISDSTGQMKKFRLANDFATEALQCTVDKYLNGMTDDERQELEERFWFERVEIGVQIEHRINGPTIFNVIHLALNTFSCAD